MITIRKAHQDEVKKLQNLNDEAFTANQSFDADLLLDWAQSEVGETYFTELLEGSSNICLVAEENDKLVGYIAAAPVKIPHRMSKYIEVENLGVAPEYRTQGLGAQLMEKCLDEAKAQGFQKVCLNCYSKNSTALKFYRHLGFEPISVDLEKDL